MRKLHRGMAAVALSVPLALSLTGVAAAETDQPTAHEAGPALGISVDATARGDGEHGDHVQDDFFGGDYDHHEEKSDGLLDLGLLG